MAFFYSMFSKSRIFLLVMTSLLLVSRDVESSCHWARLCCEGKNSSCRTEGLRLRDTPNYQPKQLQQQYNPSLSQEGSQQDQPYMNQPSYQQPYHPEYHTQLSSNFYHQQYYSQQNQPSSHQLIQQQQQHYQHQQLQQQQQLQQKQQLQQQQQQLQQQQLQQQQQQQQRPMCYCDTDCMNHGDCCLDYERACARVDCELSDWTDWTACSVTGCGRRGVRTRTRPVLVQPRNGGKACGSRKEVRPCEDTQCKVARSVQQEGGSSWVRDSARIVPAKFARWRESKEYNPYKDIRRNLFNHYWKNNEAKENVIQPQQVTPQHTRCSHYRLTQIRPYCHVQAKVGGNKTSWALQLRPGTEVCAMCQRVPLGPSTEGEQGEWSKCRGLGSRGMETRWTATTVPGCHGRWIMKHQPYNCRCDENSDVSFLLV